jgi:hypothetical protein
MAAGDADAEPRYPGVVSSSRERLGLLLPLPALLITGQAYARSPEPPPSADELQPPPDPGPERPPALDDTPASELEQAKALYVQGDEAFRRGDFREAGLAFEQSATLVPMVRLHVHAAIAFRYAATQEIDPVLANELCAATRRHAEAVAAHPQATPELIEQARAEQELADAHCSTLPDVPVGPCLSEVRCLQPDIGPCLSIIEDPRGCSGTRRRGGGAASEAMLGTLAFLGLRSRRRRDAVERLAERLPPDVVAKLRRKGDGEPSDGDQ